MCYAIVAERLHGVFECHNAKKSENFALGCLCQATFVGAECKMVLLGVLAEYDAAHA